MSAFDDARFRAAYPVSFLLRRAHRENWFRVHSLPDSKRYAETEAEWDTLIERHKSLSEAVIGLGGPCRIHYSLFLDEKPPNDLSPALTWSEASETFIGGDESVFTRTAEANWDFERFLPWIKLRANDDFGWISFHSTVTDCIYSPYDGGADVFSADPRMLLKLRTDFAAWRSSNPEGL